jgi:hypothetical protein
MEIWKRNEPLEDSDDTCLLKRLLKPQHSVYNLTLTDKYEGEQKWHVYAFEKMIRVLHWSN